MTENQFRETKETRDELRAILSNQIFRDAMGIIITKRRVLEQRFEIGDLKADALQSLRLFNQRLGMETIIVELHELTTPPSQPAQDLESTFGEEEALRKLRELEDANNL
jgi:hypothetical protein